MHSDILHYTKLAFNSLKMIQNDTVYQPITGEDRPLTQATEINDFNSIQFHNVCVAVHSDVWRGDDPRWFALDQRATRQHDAGVHWSLRAVLSFGKGTACVRQRAYACYYKEVIEPHPANKWPPIQNITRRNAACRIAAPQCRRIYSSTAMEDCKWHNIADWN